MNNHHLKQLRAKLQKISENGVASLNSINESLNQATGYAAVEYRKNRVLEKDFQLNDMKTRFKQTKEEYEALIEGRRRTQKDLDALKDRKNTLDDITRLTETYRKLLALESSEDAAKARYKKATDDFEKIQIEYLNEMRERYVEEQMYSDKIRRASTWWTWGLISTHLLLFLTVQFIVEPRKRKDLKQQMEDMLEDHSKSDRLAFQDLLAAQSARLAMTDECPPNLIQHPLPHDLNPLSMVEETPLSVTDRYEEFWKDNSYWQGALLGITSSMLAIVFK